MKKQELTAEIFSVGKWNGQEILLEDLKELARNFRLLKKTLKPPLKLGHDQKQNLLGQTDGDPALGWVKEVKVVGEKLMATFSSVPDILKEAISAGRYKQVSVEIYEGMSHEGKNLGKVLKAVALLGADLPAVKNLADLTKFFHETMVHTSEIEKNNPVTVTSFVWEKPSTAVSKKEFIQEIEELRAYKSMAERENRRKHREVLANKIQAEKKEALVFCEKKVLEGKLTPYTFRQLKENLHAFQPRRMEKEFSRQEKKQPQEHVWVPFSWLKENLEALTPQWSEEAFSSSEAPIHNNPSERLMQLAQEKMKKLGLSYREAASRALEEEPELAEAYKNYPFQPTYGA